MINNNNFFLETNSINEIQQTMISCVVYIAHFKLGFL